jgi:predicted N-acetyltransferase YhbS
MQARELEGVGPAEWAAVQDGEQAPWGEEGERLQWRDKRRHVGVRGEDGRLLALAGAVTAEVVVGDGERFPVVGIGGVIVTAAHRGRGLARKVLEAALARAAALGPSLVLLFCLPDRAGLYERFGFTAVARPILVTQPEGLAEMPLVTMWRALTSGDELPDGPVTLLGLPY